MKSKFKFKGSGDVAPQQLGIAVFGGIIILVSLIQMITGGSKRERTVQTPQESYAETGEPMYTNPTMTWYEKYLCRGYQRAGYCGFRLLHPLKPVFEEAGVDVEEAPAGKSQAMNYRGVLKHDNLDGKIVISGTSENYDARVKRMWEDAGQ